MMIEIKKKLVSVYAGAALLLLGNASVAFAQTREWFSGETTAMLTADGTLTISGPGAMESYEESSNAPWYFSRFSITKVVIKSGVTNIGKYAFFNCSEMTSVSIPKSVVSIGQYAFANSGLTALTIPDGVTNIEMTAFQFCKSLADINVNAANRHYSSKAGVLYNKNQTVLRLCPAGKVGVFAVPEGVKSIGYRAFSHCRWLTTVTFPQSLITIDDYAFQECIRLTSISLPNISSIAVGLFYDCSGLTSVIIPKKVSNIESYAFFGCSKLTSVTNRSPEPQLIIDEVFENVDTSKITLYVPTAAISAYRAADGWKDFGRFMSIR